VAASDGQSLKVNKTEAAIKTNKVFALKKDVEFSFVRKTVMTVDRKRIHLVE
jgi:hypothetical protein